MALREPTFVPDLATTLAAWGATVGAPEGGALDGPVTLEAAFAPTDDPWRNGQLVGGGSA